LHDTIADHPAAANRIADMTNKAARSTDRFTQARAR
jgi:hypothetical protein